MKKINTSPLSGMQELLPAQQAVFDQLKAKIADAFRTHGFQNIETPVIDRTEILLAKAGGDTEKQVYFVSKNQGSDEAMGLVRESGASRDEEIALERVGGGDAMHSEENVGWRADQALRFDHTVPLARYVVEHENDLAFPFLATQIGRNYRGERAQKGRFREFYQCDVDVVGRGSLPVAYDARAIGTIYDTLMSLGLPKLRMRLSNRKVLSGFLETLGLIGQTEAISGIIDHAEKVPAEVTEENLRNLGLSDENVVKITMFIGASGTPDEVEAKLRTALDDLSLVEEGLGELRTVHSLLMGNGARENVVIDLMIVRGLDYYTGTVYEVMLPEYPWLGSISSGGRYDNLASNFTEQKLPGVGGSIGLTRLFYVLEAEGLLGEALENPVDYCVVPVSESEFDYAMGLADRISAAGKSADVVLTDRKLGDKLAYAARVAKFAVVVGESEVVGGELKRKNLVTGEIDLFTEA